MNVTINIDDYISSAESDNFSIVNAAIVKGLHKIESNDLMSNGLPVGMSVRLRPTPSCQNYGRM